MGNQEKNRKRSKGRGSHFKKKSIGTDFPILRSDWSISKLPIFKLFGIKYAFYRVNKPSEHDGAVDF